MSEKPNTNEARGFLISRLLQHTAYSREELMAQNDLTLRRIALEETLFAMNEKRKRWTPEAREEREKEDDL